jgi:hypothetical protein
MSTQAEQPFYAPQQPERWIARQGDRAGYIQLSANTAQHSQWAKVQPGLFALALDWSQRLEALGAARVYWLCFSEVEPHLHWHLLPRWPEDTLKGTALFEARHDPTCARPWTLQQLNALKAWQTQHHVYVVPAIPDPDKPGPEIPGKAQAPGGPKR